MIAVLIQCMAQAEDNTFYAIDCPDFPRDEEWSFTTSQKRFLMFNNFTQQINNDYVLTLQKSYIFPTDYFNFYCKDMYKDVNSSNYVFTGVSLKDQNDPDFDSIRVINLKVNVGNENDWNKWDSDNNYWLYGASYVEFQDDNFFCRILLSQNIITNKNVSLWTKDFTQASFNLKTITTVNYYAVHDTSNYKNQSIFLNRNELYFVLNNQQWRLSNGQTMPKYIGLYYYNESTNQTQIIYEKYLGDYNFCNLEAIYIVKNNNDVYVQFNNNITQTNNDVFADYYLQRLVNDEWKPKLISSQQYFYYNRRALFVTNEFNLLNYVSYMINPQPQYWYIPNIKEIYNETNYNGEPFTDKNSLNSNSAILYSDNNPVFARNLYNKTQNGVTTMSTIEVPYNYLNDVLVDKMDLCSENNNVIISNTNGFTKNIYETVYLNFVNTISIVNNNGPQPIYNPTAATELNTSINNPEDYDNLKLTKYKINYQDGTNIVSNLQATLQDDGSYELLMTFFLNKTANSLELISEDEKTSYLTYNLRNVEINKFYSYNQRVRIGG